MRAGRAECRAYRDDPTKSVLIALGLGVLLGLLFRKGLMESSNCKG
jgi:hypothetical protein